MKTTFIKQLKNSNKNILYTLTFFICLLSAHESKAVIDYGVTAIISPISGCGLTGEEMVIIEVTNFGDEPVGSIAVAFQVDGGVIPMEVFATVIDPGESGIYYFIELADFSFPGDHNLCAWTIGPDADASNDSLCVVIEALATPEVNLGPDETICADIILDAENPGSDYLWNTGETTQTIVADISGTYWVIVTNPISGCDAADSIELIFETGPTALFTYSISGLTITFTNLSINADAYSWDFGVGTSTIEHPVFTFPVTGDYLISLTAINACDADVTTEVIFVTPVEDFEEQAKQFLIYPNPVSSYLKVSFTENICVNYKIRLVTDQIIAQGEFILEKTIPLETLPEGPYIIEFRNANGKYLGEEKFIK